MKNKILLFLYFILFSSLSAQNYNDLNFEHLNNTHGLLSDEVYTAVQDESGYIWFGTAEGIVRYDGYEFKSFKAHKHLGKLYGLRISKMHIDEEGNFYVCTNEGFYAFDKYYEPILESVEKELKGIKFAYVFKASDGYIYLSSQMGLYVVAPGTHLVNRLRPAVTENMVSPITKQIVEDSKGRIWVASWSANLLKLNDDKKSFTKYQILEAKSQGSNNVATNALFIDSRGYLWVGNWERGLYVVDISSDSEVNIIKEFHHRGMKNNIAGNIILSIEEDSYNNMWIGTPYGLSVIQYPLSKKHKIINYKPKKLSAGVSSGIVTDILNDNSNILWVATKGGGVAKLIIDRKKFDHYKIPNLSNHRNYQSVYSFETDHNGNTLLGVLSMGFVVYDHKSKDIKAYKHFPEYKVLDKHVKLNTAHEFMWDRDSVLWIGTRYNGVVTLDVKSGNVITYSRKNKTENFRGREVNVLKTIQNGVVMVGTDDGLNLMTKSEGDVWKCNSISLRDSSFGNYGAVAVSGIETLSNGNTLIATEKYGLFELVYKKGSPYIKRLNNFQGKIVCLFKDNRDIIWIGTKGKGLNFLKPGDAEIYSPNPETNIIGDIIYGINQDKYDNIWVTTNRGMSKIWTKQKELSSESYFHRDGLQGNGFLPRSFFKDRDGKFYVGGYNGFNVFEPHRIKSDNSNSPMVITEILIEGEQFDLAGLKEGKLYLDHLRNDLSISFSSLSYVFPDANQYAYKIDGLDKKWKYANSKMRSANYSNIPAGEYTFLLKGSNSQGVWNENVEELKIYVAKAPYKSWWAICLYVLIIGFIAGLIFRQRLRIARVRQDMEFEHMARVKSEKLNKYKLSFFTNISHELLTPISILSTSLYNLKMQNRVEGDTVSIMERSINGLERLIKQLLTFRKIETNSMEVAMTKEDISEVVNSTVNDFKQNAAKKDIKIISTIPESINGILDVEKWELIIRNLMSNAIKYTSISGTIWFTMEEVDSSKIKMVVKDSGCGINASALPYLFDRFYRVKSTDGNKQDGIGVGLNLTKSLVDILQGEIFAESKEGEGAQFSVILPIDGRYESESAIESVGVNELQNIGDNSIENDVIENESLNIYKEDSGTVNGKTILIVEDNEEFRKSLAMALKSNYVIIEAEDGQKGLELAEKEEIDLIISDVMMPNVGGHELCKSLKSNIKTSHIPIILLTAKVGDDNKLAGYQSGANSYLEKPVNMKLLLVRIQSLLVNFQNQREKVGVTLNLEPEKISITPLDEEFFNKAKKIIEDNISDAEYSIKDFSEELGVSNSMLYRKMKNLAGCSPSEFVRNTRLRRAAQLFENKAFQISEVAYKCGFNDLSYFGVCFKKMFGVTPTQYQEGDRGQES